MAGAGRPPKAHESEFPVKRERGGYTEEERRQLLPKDNLNPYMEDLGSPKVLVKATPVPGTKKVEETERDQTCEESNKEKHRLKLVRKPTSATTEKL